MSVAIHGHLKYLSEALIEHTEMNGNMDPLSNIIFKIRCHLEDYFMDEEKPHMQRIDEWNKLEPDHRIEITICGTDGYPVGIYHSPVGSVLYG